MEADEVAVDAQRSEWPRVPRPVEPGHADPWYAPDVQAQYEVHPGVVATVEESDVGFDYRDGSVHD
jgi:hypothetical protein